ncbi:uncharacterized protein LOC144357810 [Saccoglossus kowalevskii]
MCSFQSPRVLKSYRNDLIEINPKHVNGNPCDWLKCLEDDIGAELTINSHNEPSNSIVDKEDTKNKIILGATCQPLPEVQFQVDPKKKEHIKQKPVSGEPGRLKENQRQIRLNTVINGHSYASSHGRPEKTTISNPTERTGKKRARRRADSPSKGTAKRARHVDLVDSFEAAHALLSLAELIIEREPQKSKKTTAYGKNTYSERTQRENTVTIDNDVFGRMIEMIRYKEGYYTAPTEPEDYSSWVDVVNDSKSGIKLDRKTNLIYTKEAGLTMQQEKKRKIKRKQIFDI